MAAATALGFWSTQADALSLGRLKVQSALGEPLRAEIEILDINNDEATSLRPRLGLPDAYRASGLDYSPALSGMQLSLQKTAAGQYYLRLTNSRPVNEPYVDLIVEANWASGRVVRDYTLLLDPPNLGSAQATAPQAPQVSAATTIPVAPVEVAPPAAAVEAPAAAQTEAPVAAPAVAPTTDAQSEQDARAATTESLPPPATAPVEPPSSTTEVAALPPQEERPSTTAEPVQPAVAASKPAPATAAQRVTVKTGDTAGRIATAHKPASVSLDQMLVAMLRANPNAFIGGNVNRVKAGAVLQMPDADQAWLMSGTDARKVIQAQSRDFNEYRRRLASATPATADASADRKTSGSVQTQVEEKKAASSAPDKLTLSKGAVQSKGAEDKLAKERSDKEAAEKTAALSKNIADLEKLSKAAAPAAAASAVPPAAPAKPTASAPAAVPPLLTVPKAATPPAAQPASAPDAAAPASAPLPPKAAAPQPAPTVPVQPKPAPAPVPVAASEPSLLDELMDDPLVPAGAVGLIALLGGAAFYRSRQRKKAAQVDSGYLESKLQPDSFFGVSGGQRIDTTDQSVASPSSNMVYSSSETGGGDDVDPVAEADVYLAYGRDLQAEEILKEALIHQPDRVAIHLKLLEIYAKRQDAKSFASMSKQAYRLTGGNGPDWDHVCEMGREIDPDNATYQSGGKPAPSMPAPLQMPASFSASTEPAPPPPMPAYEPEPAPAPMFEMPSAPALATGDSDSDLDLDFSLDDASSTSQAAAPQAAMPAADNSLEFDAPELPQISMDSLPAAAPMPASATDNMMNFDLGSLSLDLGGTSSEQPGVDGDDPLATKLALADEFKAIGDTDGARALIEEIIAEASGEMKTRAQQALAQLS